MDLYEAMGTLRAVRRLREDPIPDAVLHRVLAAATWAPTGGNVQPWRVIAVREADRKKALGDLYLPAWREFSKGYGARLEGMEEAERGKMQRVIAAGDTLAECFHLAPVLLVFCFQPKLMAITDAGLERPSVVGGASVYPSVQNCLLACRVEGLGCVLTTLLCYHEEAVKEILGIPGDWYTCATVPVGYPVGGGHGSITRRPVEKMAYEDDWGTAIAIPSDR